MGLKIPHKVRIKPRISYEVVYSDVIKDDPECLGLCDPNLRQIFIKNDLCDTEKQRTFIHEVLHAIEAEYLKKSVPHTAIYAFEEGIFNLLRLNGII